MQFHVSRSRLIGTTKRQINAGDSAGTLRGVLRRRNFANGRKSYGTRQAAQSAAAEIHARLSLNNTNRALVGGNDEAPRFDAEELRKLKALAARI